MLSLNKKYIHITLPISQLFLTVVKIRSFVNVYYNYNYSNYYATRTKYDSNNSYWKETVP